MDDIITKNIKLFSGDKIEVNFQSLNECRKYKAYRISTAILCCLTILLFVLGILFFVASIENSIYIIYSVIVLLISIGAMKLYMFLIPYYNKFKYKIVIRQIKNNGWRIENSNNKTGHIKYSIKGEGYSVYVFNKRTKL